MSEREQQEQFEINRQRMLQEWERLMRDRGIPVPGDDVKKLTLTGLALISHAVTAAGVTSKASDSDNAVFFAVEVAIVIAVAFAIGAWIYIRKKHF